MLPEYGYLLQIQSVCYVIPAVMHLVGLYSLYHVKHMVLYDNQRLYLFHLSLSEFMICILKIVHRLCELYSLRDAAFKVWIVQTGTFFTAYVLIMILLTIDRYLAVLLSLKYQLWITKKKTSYSLIVCWILSVIFAIVFSLNPSQSQVRYIIVVYLWPIEEISFLIIAMVTYTYIFVKIRNNRKCSVRLKSQLQSVNFVIPIVSGNQQREIIKPMDSVGGEHTIKRDGNHDNSVNQKEHPEGNGNCITDSRKTKEKAKLRSNNNSLRRIKQRLYLPSLLIGTFVLFWIVPDQVEFFYSVNSIAVSPLFAFKINMFYVLALMTDALIYVLGVAQIRKQIFNFWKHKSRR